MRLELKDNNPVEMVGDGKQPDRYWVTASTDFEMAVTDSDGVTYIEHAETLMKRNGIESKSLPFDAVFDNLAEAIAYAEELTEAEMPAEPKANTVNRITIENRTVGTVWERQPVAYPTEWGYHFDIETRDDTDMIDN